MGDPALQLKNHLLRATAYKGLRAVLKARSFEGWLDLVDQWAAQEPGAIERVNQMLESAGLTQHGYGRDATQESC
jgi:hypothetical protein